jgi:thioester reductase-like protein
MGERVHLLTGYPGLLGKQLVRRLLAPGPERPDRLVLLVQPTHLAVAREALAGEAGVELLEGDVSFIHLGLSGAEWKALARDVTTVWHLAAKTRLDAGARLLRRVNVEGTRNVLELCGGATRLERMLHFSTAFVSGRRHGVILEEELALGQAFHDDYERTKFEAEVLVRAAQDALPITVLRPSIVVGDSRTGAIERFEGPYSLAILLAASPLSVPLPLPADPLAPLNVVPVDFVIEAALRLARHPQATGRTVHLVDPAPMPVRQVFELIAERSGRRLPALSLPGRAFDALLKLPLLERLGVASRPSLAYVDRDAVYGAANLLELLEGSDLHCPPIASYLDRLIDYVEASFSRRREGEPPAATGPAPDLPDPP